MELNVNMHCEACAAQLKRKILKMRGRYSLISVTNRCMHRSKRCISRNIPLERIINSNRFRIGSVIPYFFGFSISP